MARLAGGVAALLLALAAPLPAAADYERAELEQMLAPIALYPDSVLSHVLIAATYPDEVAEAAAWSRRHPDLAGEDAVDAVDDRDWDPSVRALVAFPEVLARLDEDPEWTEELGEAFREHEGEVMDAVQVLRERAYDEGSLDRLEHVRVVREREIIYIEPAVREVVYVPYYDPWVVYGRWWWPAYPPHCWRHWGGYAVSHYSGGFYWGVGLRIAPTFWFTSFHWPARRVVVVHRGTGYRPLYSGRDVRPSPAVRPWAEVRRPRVADHREARAPERRSSGSRRASATPHSREDRDRPRAEDVRRQLQAGREVRDRRGDARPRQRGVERSAAGAQGDRGGARRDVGTRGDDRRVRSEPRAAAPAPARPERRERAAPAARQEAPQAPRTERRPAPPERQGSAAGNRERQPPSRGHERSRRER